MQEPELLGQVIGGWGVGECGSGVSSVQGEIVHTYRGHRVAYVDLAGHRGELCSSHVSRTVRLGPYNTPLCYHTTLCTLYTLPSTHSSTYYITFTLSITFKTFTLSLNTPKLFWSGKSSNIFKGLNIDFVRHSLNLDSFSMCE